jgi:hypothetical protein
MELLQWQTRAVMEKSVISFTLVIFICMEYLCLLVGEFFFNLGCSLPDISDTKIHGGLKCIELYRYNVF